MTEDLAPFLPLSPAFLYILAALAGENLHGYGIMQAVTRQSGGQYKIGPGTLYDNLQRLMDQGIVEEASARSAKDDPRRRYYHLTRLGRRVLGAELVRLDNLVREARLRLQGARPRSG